MWWKPKGKRIDKWLKELSSDKDAIELTAYAEEQNCEMEIYVEHEDNEEEFDTINDSINDVHFEDSEEERDTGADDGFNLNEIGEAEIALNEKIHNIKTYGSPHLKKQNARKNVKQNALGSIQRFFVEKDNIVNDQEVYNSKDVNEKGNSIDTHGAGDIAIPKDGIFMHHIDEEYNSEKLDSAGDNSHTEDNNPPKYPIFRKEDMCKTFKFELGMEFKSLKDFKEAIQEHSVLNGKQIKFVKNDVVRVRVICSKSCEFKALCSKVGGRRTFRIKTLFGKHTCGRIFDNKNANSKWVAKVVVDKFRTASKLTLTEIIEDVRKNYSAGITGWRAFKARQFAREMVEGDATKQYTLLWSYSAKLQRVSNGNTCKIQLDRPSQNLQPRFASFYMCLDCCKKDFLAGSRPFIGVDGCHLKTRYGGQLLIAVGRDPNDQYLPLAFAVVETETKDSWRWFLTLLLADIGDVNTYKWVFISDQQKGLIPVFEEMLQGVEHQFCLRHLYNNFKKKFGGGTMIRDLMMEAAKCTYIEAWEDKINEIKKINSKAYDWLRVIPTSSWCKHAFSHYPRCDVLMNNISESFNSTILLATDKPIISMLEWIRAYLMGRFAVMKEKLSKYQGNVMPKPRRRLDREVEMSGNWLATWAGELRFEVSHIIHKEKFIVNLSSNSCTCNFWGLVGIPCRYAVAAITYKGDDPELYMHKYYKRETYELCYAQQITPINGENMWPKTQYEDILPPMYKLRPGRPKKLRKREPNEDPKPTKPKRSHSSNKCSWCHKYGHNSRRCKNPAISSQTSTTMEGEKSQVTSHAQTNNANQNVQHNSQNQATKKLEVEAKTTVEVVVSDGLNKEAKFA
ncbi:hypothetical protein VNO77_03220 [Canavalia gladiata]|uniref:SWIM-type domain-containing protein n=1 Tax=Canavalia gladiata TaxID=3824 RepID=A0AAN9R7Y1_CANGL